jgi:hypothetical protein
MKALIRETQGYHVGPMGQLVGFDDLVNFSIDVQIPLNTADEPFLVIFDDGSWGIHNAVETDEMLDDDGPHSKVVHQGIPFNAIFREFIAYESSRPVLNLTYAPPVPDLNDVTPEAIDEPSI